MYVNIIYMCVNNVPSEEGVAKVLYRLGVSVGGASSQGVRGQGLSILLCQMELLKTAATEERGGLRISHQQNVIYGQVLHSLHTMCITARFLHVCRIMHACNNCNAFQVSAS